MGCRRKSEIMQSTMPPLECWGSWTRKWSALVSYRFLNRRTSCSLTEANRSPASAPPQGNSARCAVGHLMRTTDVAPGSPRPSSRTVGIVRVSVSQIVEPCPGGAFRYEMPLDDESGYEMREPIAVGLCVIVGVRTETGDCPHALDARVLEYQERFK
jgi:hypothetical protein